MSFQQTPEEAVNPVAEGEHSSSRADVAAMLYAAGDYYCRHDHVRVTSPEDGFSSRVTTVQKQQLS